MERKIKVGDVQQTFMKDLWGLAIITDVKEIKTETASGLFVYYEYPDVKYTTQAVFINDGAVLDSRVHTRRSRSGIPLEYVYCNGKSIDWKKYGKVDVSYQKALLNTFVINFDMYQREGRGLYIYSKANGSGKTMIACAVANEILKTHDISVKFINIADYIELVKLKDDASRETIKSIREAGLLILDDIGAQVENKDWITTALFRLIDWRYSNHYPIIFTSNIKREDLKTDPRIASRIYEVSVPVIMPEVDVRKQIADEKTKEFLKRALQERGTESEAIQIFS